MSTGRARFVFGTARANDPDDAGHVELVRTALDAGAGLHGAVTYGRSLEVIAAAARLVPNRPVRLTAKSRTRTPDDLRREVDQTLERAGVERLEALQVCAGPPAADLAPDRPLRRALERLREDGTVGGLLLEMFHQRCAQLGPLATTGLFDGVVTYVNVFNRELDQRTWDAVRAAGKQIVALRPFCGGRLGSSGRVDRARGKALERGDAHAAKWDAIDALAVELGCEDLSRLSLRYVLSAPGVSAVVGSTRRLARLSGTLRDAETLPLLEPDVVARIEDLHRSWWAAAGAGYEPNESTELPVPPEPDAGSDRGGFGARLRRWFSG